MTERFDEATPAINNEGIQLVVLTNQKQNKISSVRKVQVLQKSSYTSLAVCGNYSSLKFVLNW